LAATPDAAVQSLEGWHMPAESERHARTFMQWPVRTSVYGARQLKKVQAKVALIANTISRYEPVVMLASTAAAEAARKHLDAKVELWPIPTDDLWCRDSGPTFVKSKDGRLAVARLAFNGWGNKQTHANDGQIAPRLAARLGLPLLATGLVGEQGGLEHDGDGTVLAHASCWVNRNRNRGTPAEIEARILAATGSSKMIWAPGIKGADITDYHIDALARFTAPGRVLIQLPGKIDRDDPWSKSAYETYEILKTARDAQGRKLEIVVLNEPVDIRVAAKDFVASYVNYYVCNDAVISAQFGDAAADARAAALLKEIYPDRAIEQLDIDAIGEVGGGIHCATQQMPAT